MVEDVEGFGAKLQSQSFVDRKFSPNGDIHLPGTKPPDDVARGVPLNTPRWHSEGVGIDRPASGTFFAAVVQSRTFGSGNVQWLAWNFVQTAVELLASSLIGLDISLKRNRETRSCREAV